jgi:hypothetical protein
MRGTLQADIGGDLLDARDRHGDELIDGQL